MKILKYIMIILAAAAAGALGGAVWQSSQNIKLTEERKPVIRKNDMDFSYVLRDCGGFLAIYRGKSPVPFSVLEYQTSFLNEYDRSLAEEGISVPDETSMRILIEDLTG